MKEEKKKFVAIRLNAELHHKLKMQALKEKKSIQLWLEEILVQLIDSLSKL